MLCKRFCSKLDISSITILNTESSKVFNTSLVQFAVRSMHKPFQHSVRTLLYNLYV